MDAFIALGGDNGYTPLRVGPIQPLGSGANYFPVSAATPIALDAETHPSGYAIRIKLENTHPDLPFRTSEQINGQLKIYSKLGMKQLTASRLSLRVYFESRTLFMGLRPKQSGALNQRMQNMKSAAAQDYDNVMGYEVHRGVIPSENLILSWDPKAQLDAVLEPGNGHSEVSIPFSFTIPQKMAITEFNKYSGAPRNLCPVRRHPPPTLRDSPVGSIQWIVEAVMDLAPNVQREQDEMMFLKPTDQRRIHGEGAGTKKVMEAKGGKWEAYVKEIAVLEKYHVRSEVYVNSGSRLSTDAPVLPLVLFLKHTGTRASALPSFLRSSKPKTMHLTHATITVRCTTSTRGGKEVVAHVRNVMVRRHELRFDADSGSSKPGIAIPSGDAAPLEIDLTFDVQSQEEMNLSATKQFSVPARNFTPSFRTPNIEHEYHIMVYLKFAGDEVQRIATQFPVQVVLGSIENQLPPYQDVAPEYSG
ncbi:hypothetical protein RHS01_06611 [Rhizoctonia solani]|uniref:Uncharacterized protein n=1 Tax=Rhizoctonia solani TaxID=456999 RepID=A0A8H7IBJ6_9AGAM|nr:hypothetical protein RHS01_06611 [Rhizoctonia solani]